MISLWGKEQKMNINQICYCRDELDAADDMNAEEGWRCRSCQQLVHQSLSYRCHSNKCLYTTIAKIDYITCSNCFHTAIKDDMDSEGNCSELAELTDKDFIFKKTEAMMDIISLVHRSFALPNSVYDNE